MREIQDDKPDVPLPRIGPYELIRLLGVGGTSRVYRSKSPADGKPVAVKMMCGASCSAEALEKFNQKMVAIASIRHANVAQIVDHGVGDDGTPYAVMEFVDGPSLADLIHSRVTLPYSRVASLMVQSAQGLQAAFKNKIIHRDIKPGNLMIDAEGNLKIVDFGLARRMFDPLESSGRVEGTPRYMAPEQVMGGSVDQRSDMYALGASFYHFIAGQPPFEAETAEALMQEHVQASLMPLYVINPEVPGDLSEVVQRLMAKDPNDRFEDYDALIAALREVELARRAKETTYSYREEDDAPAMDTAGETAVETAADAPEQRAPSSVFAMPLAIAAVIACLLALTAFLTRKVPDAEGQERSEWTALISMIKDKVAPPGEDEKRIQLMQKNVQRMHTVRAACLDYLLKKREFPNSLNRLVESGATDAEGLHDAWGREMAVYPMKQVIVSFGEDGLEGSSDDFEMDSDGTLKRQPAMLAEFAARSLD